jgi:hypothetical protein
VWNGKFFHVKNDDSFINKIIAFVFSRCIDQSDEAIQELYEETKNLLDQADSEYKNYIDSNPKVLPDSEETKKHNNNILARQLPYQNEIAKENTVLNEKNNDLNKSVERLTGDLVKSSIQLGQAALVRKQNEEQLNSMYEEVKRRDNAGFHIDKAETEARILKEANKALQARNDDLETDNLFGSIAIQKKYDQDIQIARQELQTALQKLQTANGRLVMAQEEIDALQAEKAAAEEAKSKPFFSGFFSNN